MLRIKMTLARVKDCIMGSDPNAAKEGINNNSDDSVFINLCLSVSPQNLPCLLRRMQSVSGFVFGTIWWGFALNMIAYFVASHAAGACWFLLGLQRATKCLTEQCHLMNGCTEKLLASQEPLFYGSTKMVKDSASLAWASNRNARNLPEGLRRDIKYHLCLDLVRQVPLFQHMEDLVLENICDRVKSLIFTKGETITREGDPVRRMLFIVRGHLQSCQVLRDGVKSCCMLGPGNFSGDELLSWCLRRPFVERLPPASSTLVTLETTPQRHLGYKYLIITKPV